MEGEHLYNNSNLENNIQDVEHLRGCFDTAIIVLQGGIDPGYESESEKYAKIPYLPRMRMFAGIIEYNKSLEKGESPVLILSGGATTDVDGRTVSEAKAMKQLLLLYEVEEGRIIEETNSIDTIGNAEYTSEILEKLGFLEKGNVKLITNAFHLKRSDNAFREHFARAYTARSAEDILMEQGKKFVLPGDQDPKPYGEFAQLFLGSKKNVFLRRKDELIELVSKIPGGRELLLYVAENTRR